MNASTPKNGLLRLTALAALAALASGPAAALDVYLATKPVTMTLPDASTVPLWVYVADPDGNDNGEGDCWESASDAARLACVAALTTTDPALPGPRVTVPPGDSTLRIYLSNGLPEPTSVTIPGQARPVSSGSGPVWDNGSSGPRTGPNQRVRSFGAEAPANGGRQSYAWTLARSGTFLYHSGTWPQRQVYMGLYGLGSRDHGSNLVYPDVPYANEVVLFYSDLDPVLNKSIWCEVQGTPTCLWNGTETVEPYTTSIDYRAQWFLVNGAPYVQGETAPIPAGAAGTNTLLRLASTASETHVATLQGLYMKIHAEDGFRYTWQNGAGTGGFSPREQYSAELPALKTKDAILVAPATGTYAIYDGNGYMTNPSDPNDFTEGDELGGMLRFLAFTADTDGDGVADTADLCPNTPAGVPVDATGCPTGPLDADGDGVSDALDQCPGTPAGESVDANGCAPSQLDSDGDTVNDALDQCPGTPAGQTVNANGCAPSQLDTDNDGVNDALDQCPGTPAGTPVGPNGCPPIWLYFSTFGNGAVGSLANTDDADIYNWNGVSAGRTWDATAAGLPNGANVDGLHVVDADTFYLSFTDTVALPGLGNVPDEDIVLYDAGSWTLYFDGSARGLAASADIDAISVNGSVLYFSTLDNSAVPGTGGAGAADDADVYSWNGTAFARVLDASTVGLPGGADVDGLTVIGSGSGIAYYLSFDDSLNIAGLGTVQDEDIVSRSGTTWSWRLDGTAIGLSTNGSQDIDAIHVLP